MAESSPSSSRPPAVPAPTLGTLPSIPTQLTSPSIPRPQPYNMGICRLSSPLIPYNLDIMASGSHPTLGLNITKVLLDVAAPMLTSFDVIFEFKADEGRVPTTLLLHNTCIQESYNTGPELIYIFKVDQESERNSDHSDAMFIFAVLDSICFFLFDVS